MAIRPIAEDMTKDQKPKPAGQPVDVGAHPISLEVLGDIAEHLATIAKAKTEIAAACTANENAAKDHADSIQVHLAAIAECASKQWASTSRIADRMDGLCVRTAEQAEALASIASDLGADKGHLATLAGAAKNRAGTLSQIADDVASIEDHHDAYSRHAIAAGEKHLAAIEKMEGHLAAIAHMQIKQTTAAEVQNKTLVRVAEGLEEIRGAQSSTNGWLREITTAVELAAALRLTNTGRIGEADIGKVLERFKNNLAA